MGVFVVDTLKSWNIENFNKLKNNFTNHTFYMITENHEFTRNKLEIINPDMIFLPHWSFIIKEDIYNKFKCVVFHMTDLPFGRGGSPLQNLLVRGIYNTKISAISVDGGLDTGDIYIKEPVDISTGSAEDIYRRISEIIFSKMIPRLISEEIIPVKQNGEIISFKRRKPEQSEIPSGLCDREIYDYIRMLDAEGYPKAFIKQNDKKIFFTSAELEDGRVKAIAEFEVE